jgi:hypothetical protein
MAYQLIFGEAGNTPVGKIVNFEIIPNNKFIYIFNTCFRILYPEVLALSFAPFLVRTA